MCYVNRKVKVSSKIYAFCFSLTFVCSVILEVNDQANNTANARALVLVDSTSKITLQEDRNVYVSTARNDTGFVWITDKKYMQSSNDVTVNWEGRFINR